MGNLDLGKAYPNAQHLTGESERSATTETKAVHANGARRDVVMLSTPSASEEYQLPAHGEIVESVSGVEAMIQADIDAGDGWQTASRETNGVFDAERGKKQETPVVERKLNPHARTAILRKS